MGEVFLAEDLRLERKVAIKMLLAKSIGDDQAKKRLLREARAAATLDHPNICAIHEVSEEGDCTFIVMQYVEGNSLASIVKNNPLPTLEVIDIGMQVAEAIAHAHSHGIIHRDIKPQNVIVTPRGQIKVLDFGLAKLVKQAPDTVAETESRLTDAGQVVGTVGYMSPEQLRGHHLDGRTDLFSLGATLYECATGKPAFSGPSTIDISLQVLQVDPPKPSEFNPGVPSELDDIIAKATAKDVDARYQSADAVVEDLRKLREKLLIDSQFRTRALTPRPGVARVSITARIPRTLTAAISGTLNRTPVKVGGFLAPLAILAIWLTMSIWHSSPHQPTPEAKGWYDQGLAAMRAGTYYQASKRLERSLELDDRFALAHARLAETYVEVDNTEKAMEELLRAISLVPDRSALASTDAIYMDAVGATVRREFAAAIEHYAKILEQTSDSEKANAYLDLGRAYEKNENQDKATECYLEATKLDAQSPASFLRLAILYSRRQDSKNAEDAFKEAEKIYRTMSNDEGRTEVFYQRALLLEKTGKLSEAKAQLGNALEILKNVDNKYQLIKTQLELSLVYRDEGNIEGAKDLAAEAIRLAQANNIKNLATNGLIDLGLALLNRGEFDEGGKYFRQALDLAQRDKTRRSEARAILSLGRLNQQLGNTDEAISQLQEALKFYKPGGYRRETSLALTVLGRAYSNKGEHEVASKIFEEQLELVQEWGDLSGVSDFHMSMALMRGLNQELYPEALSHLDEKYKIDESRGARVQMGFDQMNRGSYLWQLGRYYEARAALDSAFNIASRPEANAKAVLAWVHLNNAQIALSQSHYNEAKNRGQLALEVSALQFPDVTLHAKRTIGLAEALSGVPQPAKVLCEEAVAIAKKVNFPRHVSSALLTLAEVLLLEKDAQGALVKANEAQAMFAQSEQQDSEWHAWLIAARANEQMGNKSAAQNCASRANSLCAGLEQKWGKENYESYLRRPDIQSYRDQIAQILRRSK